MGEASDSFVNTVKKHISAKSEVCVCEIGVGEGETPRRVSPLLRPYDRYYFLDYSEKIENVKKMFPAPGHILIGIGNSRKTYDSYAWSLQKLYFDLKNIEADPRIFDVVFLDASNIFIHDASACAILKMMMKDGAEIIVNNTNWTFSRSRYWNPKKNPTTQKILNTEQIDVSMTSVVCDALFESDESFTRTDSSEQFRQYTYGKTKSA